MPRSEIPAKLAAPVRRVAAVVVSPIQRLLAIEAASGIVLLAATAAALVLANLAPAAYADVWQRQLFGHSVGFWINDGLMTVFFFVVGLEIRREIHEGELSTLKKAALPFAAALGGMLAPAAIFAALNVGRAGSAGWAIPMATDIAFAVGILTLLGSRVPGALRVLLLALAVIDDIGAIIVIAIFYTSGVSLSGFAIVGGGIGLVVLMRALGVRLPVLYVLPGIIVWVGFLVTGIHPTIAGVVLGLLTPVHPPGDESPGARLIHSLHPWNAFVIMPIFALANAGVVLGGADLSGDHLWLFAGIVAGLALGKPLGITAASLAASGAGIAARSEDITRRGVVLVGLVGGIGFTMSLFIAQLAFPAGPLLDIAKLAILVGSATSMVVGLAYGVMQRRST